MVGSDSSHWIRIFVALLSAIWDAEEGRIDDANSRLQDAVEAGLARMPLPDGQVLLNRLARHARLVGAAYLEARALELTGDLEVTSPLEGDEPSVDVPTILTEDPTEGPTELKVTPNLNG
jgi:hypothetical protein